VALVAVVGMLGACGPLDEAEQSTEAVAAELDSVQVSPTQSLRVMTQNLYLGASLSDALTLQPRMLPLAIELTLKQIVATDFRVRAREIAAAIEKASPDLIGVQEAERVELRIGLLSPQRMPTTYDYLEILLAELEDRGLCYQKAIVGDQTDIELPVGYTCLRVRYKDRDAILARCGVAIEKTSAGHYLSNLGLDELGHPLTILRGWEAVQAKTEAGTFLFFNTHLEPATLPAFTEIQLAQAAQLLETIRASVLPAVVVGDFNSAADSSTTPTYELVLEKGLADVWDLARNKDPGYTCCQAPDLANAVSELSQRIDFVFVRNFAEPLRGSAAVVDDRILPGFDLWPSDHAGVLAIFRVPQSKPLGDLPEVPEIAYPLALPSFIR
jgi:endonuclease/exonuclease/phosphatase family metal-dependent hydrolase